MAQVGVNINDKHIEVIGIRDPKPGMRETQDSCSFELPPAREALRLTVSIPVSRGAAAPAADCRGRRGVQRHGRRALSRIGGRWLS
jgi:hypothetical protein